MRPGAEQRMPDVRERLGACCGLILAGAIVLGPVQAPGTGKVWAQSPPPGSPPAETVRAQRKLERWQQLSPEARRKMARMLEKLRQLPPLERRLLVDRLRSMDSTSRRALLERARRALDENPVDRGFRQARLDLLRRRAQALPPAERRRFAKLPPADQRRYLEEKSRARRQDLLSRLPPAAREEAEKLPPREQAEFLRHFRGRQAFRETFRDPEEVSRLRALPPERIRELLRLRRTGPGAPPAAARPDSISEETWRRWLELKPYERPRVLRYLLGPREPLRQGEPGRQEL